MVAPAQRPAGRGRRAAAGPVTVPNHKLVPDVRYLLDAGVDDVLPRTRLPQAGQTTRGVALFVTGGRRFLTHPAYGPFDQLDDNPLIQVPGAGLPARRLRPLPGGVRQLRLTHAPPRGLLDQPPRRPAGEQRARDAGGQQRDEVAFVPRSKPSVFRQNSITMKWKRKTPKETFPSQRATRLSASRASRRGGRGGQHERAERRGRRDREPQRLARAEPRRARRPPPPDAHSTADRGGDRQRRHPARAAARRARRARRPPSPPRSRRRTSAAARAAGRRCAVVRQAERQRAQRDGRRRTPRTSHSSGRRRKPSAISGSTT